jgi:hypothetical protein
MIGPLTLILPFVASIANAPPLDPGQIEMLDGDTIRVAGETFRLVGFDAPETYRARCASERELGNRLPHRDGRNAALQLRPLMWRAESARTGCGRAADRIGFGSRVCVRAHLLPCSGSMVPDALITS